MKFQISNNHPILALTPHVEAYSRDFLKFHGFNYFQYGRCYPDGSIICFHNTNDLLKVGLEHGFGTQSSFKEEHQKLPSYIFFWDEELPETPVSLVREKANMHHGMTIVKRHKDFYDMVAFAMPKPRTNALSYFANHIKGLEAFAKTFIQSRTDLISLHEKEKLTSPVEYQDSNRSKICLPDRRIRFDIRGTKGRTYVTAQELFCLQYLAQNRSYKEISQNLSISTRTIETYLERVKARTGYSTKEQLLRAISLCP